MPATFPCVLTIVGEERFGALEGKVSMSLSFQTGVRRTAGILADGLVAISGGPVAQLVELLWDRLDRSVAAERPKPVDQRLARLDDAKAALAESLAALDELQLEAERSKAEHALTQAALEKALSSKKDAEAQLAEVREIMAGEVSAFQVVAGVTDVRKERLIGFFNGILSSAAFALILWGGDKLIDRFNLFG